MRLLVIEDHLDIAENIGDYLEPKGHNVDFAADGMVGLSLAESNDYDVIILDLMLPRLGGIELCTRLRVQKGINTPVLMLTARDLLKDKEEGFEAGADDYLVKPFSMRELEIRAQALDRRHRRLAVAKTLNVGSLFFNTTTLEATRDGAPLTLNPMTRRLLKVLMENSHRVVSRSELEYALWGDNPPDGDVLRAHIHSLRTVVDKPFTEKLVHTVHKTGYRLNAE